MKKNTFKKYICLALCLVLAASVLAGCGSTSGAASEPAAATEAPAAATEAPAEESAAPAGLVDSIKAKGKLVVGTEARMHRMNSRIWTQTLQAATCGLHSR